MKLTNTACKNIRPGEKSIKLFDGQGLYLEVTPAGNKLWRLKYRYHGKEKRIALGAYPEISLLEVREKKDSARRLLAEGKDPSLERKKRKSEIIENAGNTFEKLAREWHEHNCNGWSENHARTVMRRLEADIFPKIGFMPIKDINAPILLDCVRAIEKREAFEMARRSLQYCGQIFRYAIVTGRGERDISSDLKGALKPFKRGHYAAMDIKELPEFLSILYRNEARLFPQTQMAIELLMMTFVRTGELIKARWIEFDWDDAMWIIPAARMKMGKPHMVPLSKQALVLFKRLQELNGHREYVFPSQRHPRNHMSNNAILVAMDRMGYRGTHTGHGFRALAMSTIKEKLGYRHEVIDRQLAHAHKNTIDKAYDRAQFLDERIEMMQKWADYLEQINKSGEVIQARFGTR